MQEPDNKSTATNSTLDQQQLTELLQNWDNNNKKTQEQVLIVIWAELKKLASMQLRASNKVMLQTTELANEAYLKLAGQHKHEWQNRAHFFAITSQLIRRIVVDHVRKNKARKHGGEAIFVTMHESAVGFSAPDRFPDWLILDSTLNQLQLIDPLAVKVIEMRFLIGMNIEEVAQGLDISISSVKRKWRFARAWLRQQLSELDDQHE